MGTARTAPGCPLQMEQKPGKLQMLRSHFWPAIGIELPKGNRAGAWSRGILDNEADRAAASIPAPQEEWPKNGPIFDAIKHRFAFLGQKAFDWSTGTQPHPKDSSRTVRVVRFKNFPTVERNGREDAVTLVDALTLPLKEFTAVKRSKNIGEHLKLVGKRAFDTILDGITRMNLIGLGYKLLDGVTWRPGLEIFRLPFHLKQQQDDMFRAVFTLYDCLLEMFGSDREVTRLLSHKVPEERILAKYRFNRERKSRVQVLRPDIVVGTEEGSGELALKVTELESAPAGLGMLHAMQLGYDLDQKTVQEYSRLLNGRPYLVFATHEWAEYTFEIASFLNVLRDVGINACLVFDQSLEYIQEHVVSTWALPDEAPAWAREEANSDWLGRITKRGWDTFIFGTTDFNEVETLVGFNPSDAAIFRFGYFDNFPKASIDALYDWERSGADVLNGMEFYLENKALMAAPWLSSVAEWFRAQGKECELQVLRTHLAETRLIDPELFNNLNEVVDEKGRWCVKFAAWDGDNKSWGARSLEVGIKWTVNKWRELVTELEELPHPVIAQHMIRSALFTSAYVDRGSNVQLMWDCRTRFTPFGLRLITSDGEEVVDAGGMMTECDEGYRVHGKLTARETATVFVDDSAKAKAEPKVA